MASMKTMGMGSIVPARERISPLRLNMRFEFPRPLLLCWGALSRYVWMELFFISTLVPLHVLCAIYPSSSDVFMRFVHGRGLR